MNEPTTYSGLLASIKHRIQHAQARAAVAVNQELVLLYWGIGKEILARQSEEGWGAKVIDLLARDLRQAFPEMKGLSPRNLKYMRAFAEAWPEEEIVQGALAQLPWYHQLTLLEKLKAKAERMWYAKQAIENDVHVVGISSQAAGHKTLVPKLIECLRKAGAADILVVVGGIIPRQDYDFLRAAGAAAIFGPGTPIPDAAAEVLKAIKTISRKS